MPNVVGQEHPYTSSGNTPLPSPPEERPNTPGPRKPTLTAAQSLGHAFAPPLPWTSHCPGPNSPIDRTAATSHGPDSTRPRKSNTDEPVRRWGDGEETSSGHGLGRRTRQRKSHSPQPVSWPTWFPEGNCSTIYDPDFPDGPPPCLSPKAKQSVVVPEEILSPPDIPISKSGRLTVSEVAKFGAVGTLKTVWGEEIPTYQLCVCDSYFRIFRSCPVHPKVDSNGQLIH